MQAIPKFTNLRSIISISLVLIILFIAGCSPLVKDNPTPETQFDSIGTAQAQTSDLEFSPPPQEILPDFEIWVNNNSYVIQSIDSTDFSDLLFLEPLLEGKRIVQLGEDEHGTVEQSLMKIRLIKYLHQELEYEVIALETGFLDCFLTNDNILNLSPTEAMDRIFYGNPLTEDILPLFEYVIETAYSPSPLELAGFDLYSLGEGLEEESVFFHSLLIDLDINYASEIRTLEESFLSPARGKEVLSEINDRVGYQEAIKAYEALADYINQNQQTLRRKDLSTELINVAEQAAWSRARYIEAFHYLISNTEGEHITVRDKSMAVNVRFLAEELYPDRKIIIWAHNGHIAEKSPWPGSGIDNMGTYLVEYFGEDIYTIGLIGHRSIDSYWSLENQLHLFGKPYLFVDLSSTGKNNNSSNTPTQILTESDAFDALLYLDNITSHHPLENK
jgi:erythromycin esterase